MTELSLFNFEQSAVSVLTIEDKPWFVAKEVAAILSYADPSMMLKHVDDEDKQTINPQKFDSVVQTRSSKSFNENTFKLSIINKKGLSKVLMKATKVPLIARANLAKDFGIKLDKIMETRVETELVHSIQLSFSHIPSIKQFFVLGYKVDLYFPLHRIAVECDERAHNSYNLDNEASRQNAITQTLGCTFIRFDPYSKSFDLGKVINAIMLKIYKES